MKNILKKRTTQYILFLVFCLISLLTIIDLSSCSEAHKLYKVEEKAPNLFKTTIDSTDTSTILYSKIDTAVFVPSKTTTLTDTLYKETMSTHGWIYIGSLDYNKTIKNGNSSATLIIHHGIAKVICHDSAYMDTISILKKTLKEYKTVKYTTLAQSKPQYLTHWYDNICRFIAVLDILLIILIVVVRYVKK